MWLSHMLTSKRRKRKEGCKHIEAFIKKILESYLDLSLLMSINSLIFWNHRKNLILKLNLWNRVQAVNSGFWYWRMRIMLEKIPSPAYMPKHMEIGPGSPQPALTRVTVWVLATLCKGGVGVQGFSRPAWEVFFLHCLGGGLPLAGRVFFLTFEFSICL